MLEINKNYVLDTNQQPIAVQIPIAEFEKIEEILEDYGLAQLMEAVSDDKTLTKEEALEYLNDLKKNNVAS
jgi:hypothetical protein